MSAICGQRLLDLADYITEVPVRLQAGPLWKTVDSFGFKILAQGNFIWGKKKNGTLSHCFLQNISPDQALLLIEHQRRASMIRGRPQISMASKTVHLQTLIDAAPVWEHYRSSRFRPDHRAIPTAAGPKFE